MSKISDILASTGRFPPIEMRIKPLASALGVSKLDNFLEYSYESSILIPVDSFHFTFVLPEEGSNFQQFFREGDIAQLYANQQAIATGLIDQVEVEVDHDSGEIIRVSGRDLMGQFEDQDAVNIDSSIIAGANMTVQQLFDHLKVDTRIPKLVTQDASTQSWIVGTEPQESKLAVLQRYLEPLNCIAWMNPDGSMTIGKPNMTQKPVGKLFVDDTNRDSNCLGMKATFAASTIPNILIPVWAGQEVVQSRITKSQRLENAAPGPARLLKLGHRLSKCVVVSNPEGDRPQSFAEANAFRAGGANVLQAYAKREAARNNTKELIVEVSMAGHYNQDGTPFRYDTIYTINFPRALFQPIDMYCYGVKYTLSPEEGQKTILSFCNKGTIVSDVKVQ